MNGTVPLWLKGVLCWIGIIALGLLVSSFCIYLLAPSPESYREASLWVVILPAVIGPLTMSIIIFFAQRRDFKDPDAPHFRIQEQVPVARSPQAIFAYLSNPQNNRRLNPQITNVKVTSEGLFRLGTTYEQREFWIQKSSYSVSKFEPPRRIEVRGHSGKRKVVGEYDLAQSGADTLITLSIEMAFTTLEAPLQPLNILYYRAAMRAQAQKFRRVLEQEL